MQCQKKINYLPKNTDEKIEYLDSKMIHALLLLLVVVSSCQPKKRGVICGRVDVNSGQCTTQLSGDTKTDDPPELPEIPTLPPKDDDPLTTNETQITEDTLLKDITINSRCLNDKKCSTAVTCKVTDCGEENLILFTENNMSDSTSLCAGNNTARVGDLKEITCGFLLGDDFDGGEASLKLTSERLNQESCLLYILKDHQQPNNFNISTPCATKPITVNNGNIETTVVVIELTFSLK